MKDTIREKILQWSKEHPRHLPWKGIKDPYRIWVSEIILQQTRVEQGLPYFHRFLEAFPDVYTLAEADLDLLYKVWEGLGYYRRARHMHEAAQHIVSEHAGHFPKTYEEILALKGVGTYTAAAIASFAFDLPYAVLDGNVARVLARVIGETKPVDTTSVQRRLQDLAQEVLDDSQPGPFNQAMMDFGAMQCTPKQPSCQTCPIKKFCQAYKKGLVAEIPRKKKKIKKKDRFFYYLIFKSTPDHFWVKQRQEDDIWAHLYEFFLVERDQDTTWSQVLNELDFPVEVRYTTDKYVQLLTHQRISAYFAELKVRPQDERHLNAKGLTLIKKENLRNFAFPKVIDCYLADNSLNLNLPF